MKTTRSLKKSFYDKNRIRYYIFIVLTIIDGLANLAISVLLKEIADTAASGNLGMIKRMCLWTLITLASISASSVALYYAKSSFVRHAVTNYKKRIMDKILETEQFLSVNKNPASYLSSLTNDIFLIETDYLQGMAEIISNIFFFTASLFMMIWYSPLLTAASILLMLIPIIISLLFGRKLEKEVKNVSDANAKFVKQIQDILRGFPVIKSFHAEKATGALYAEHNRSLEQSKYRKNIVAGRINLCSTLSNVSAQFGIFLFGAYLAVAEKGVTAGTLIAFVSLLGQIAPHIGRLPGLIASRKATGALIEKAEKNIATGKQNLKTVPIANTIHTISLQNVSFSYDEYEALRNVSLQFHQGKSYAIVGESGSGKTTLLHLIMAHYNCYSGLITYDNIDARTVTMESLTNHISEIRQDVFLFDATIWDNVTMFQKFPENKVSDALKKAGLTELIAHKGSEYMCGENGCNLSGGEKQRISIARCFLKEASVLIADEATAALDAETSFRIINEILHMERMTKIIVSHKINQSLLKQYDQIIVMKNGKVQELGSFDELMGKKAYFYSLYHVVN